MDRLKSSPGLLRRSLGWVLYVGFILIVAAATAWAGLAIYIQLTGGWQIAAWGLLGLAFVTALVLRWFNRRAGWAVALVAALVVGVWYQTIQPRQDRDWAADVAHGVSSVIDGNHVTLQNVRNFDWTTGSDAVEHWESRSYDLRQMATVDMITSTWGDPNIAHLIVSFGFDDGQRLGFSVEIRKEKGESFSALGGFFRQFEMVLIAADENDVVRVRTNRRGEDVHLFSVKLKPEQMRTLFLSYLGLANRLAETPVFYNTITANCTSTVYGLVQVIKPDMPLDRRLVFSGLLPEYIDELGGLPGDMPMAERRAEAAISARALAVPDGADYSIWVRTRS
ncbi:MAG: DUF4105 domain-containing protein [bacterium]